MLTKEEIEILEAKLKDDYHCIIQATSNHEPLGKDSFKINLLDLGEVVGCLPESNNLKVKWSRNDTLVNYLTNLFTPVPFDILRYVPKDHPAQQKINYEK